MTDGESNGHVVEIQDGVLAYFYTLGVLFLVFTRFNKVTRHEANASGFCLYSHFYFSCQ